MPMILSTLLYSYLAGRGRCRDSLGKLCKRWAQDDQPGGGIVEGARRVVETLKRLR